MQQKPANSETLPPPSTAARRHSAALCRLIEEEISRQGGQISFARYMDLALHAPGLGYYSAGASKFGAAGDFVTAPEISPLYSRCIARQCRQVIEALDHAEILEVGAGSGIMACDILLELEALGALPTRYLILEVSADLRQRQRLLFEQRIPELLPRVIWLDHLPASGFNGVVLANELLDAMPVHRCGILENELFEMYVTTGNGEFAWSRGALSEERLRPRLENIRYGLSRSNAAGLYVTEVNLAALDWIVAIAGLLQQGLLLIIDYGFAAREFYHPERCEGSLMCHYRHRAHPDPLILTGLQDITAHVDFSSLAETAVSNGLSVSGFTTQAHFLLASGITEVMAVAAEDDVPGHDLKKQIELAQQIKKLTLPYEMGELFKVLALTRGLDMPLAGFTLQDFRERL